MRRMPHLIGALVILICHQGVCDDQEPTMHQGNRQLTIIVQETDSKVKQPAEGSQKAAETKQPDAHTAEVTLRPVPQLVLQDTGQVTAENIERIKSLIGVLSRIDRPDYGFSSTMSGQAFLPVDGQTESSALLLVNHGFASSSALRELVAFGPDAIPFLLQSLQDQTPTRIKLEHYGGFGAMWFAREMSGNPLNPLEASLPSKGHIIVVDETDAQDVEEEWDQRTYVEQYTVKVGDICFVAIGQIVGRSYEAVRYQPTACIVVNSPTHDPELASKVKTIWTFDKPREGLFRSLLRDYSSIDSQLQCGAALRLLYYYPDESGQLIADRLRSLDVEGTDAGELNRFREREAKNRVDTKDFIHAVSWSGHPLVREAVTVLFLKTTDKGLMLAAVPGVIDPEGTIIPQRLQPLLHRLPPDEGPIYGFGWQVLLAWTKASPESARIAMEEYLQNGETQRLQTACAVLSRTSPDWKTAFLRPLLDDKRDLKSWTRSETRRFNGQQIKIRLCDMAASVLAEEDKTLAFTLGGPVEQVDRQIATIRQTLDQRRN